jgi:hypothetical protein
LLARKQNVHSRVILSTLSIADGGGNGLANYMGNAKLDYLAVGNNGGAQPMQQLAEMSTPGKSSKAKSKAQKGRTMASKKDAAKAAAAAAAAASAAFYRSAAHAHPHTHASAASAASPVAIYSPPPRHVNVMLPCRRSK